MQRVTKIEIIEKVLKSIYFVGSYFADFKMTEFRIMLELKSRHPILIPPLKEIVIMSDEGWIYFIKKKPCRVYYIINS